MNFTNHRQGRDHGKNGQNLGHRWCETLSNSDLKTMSFTDAYQKFFMLSQAPAPCVII